MRRAALGVASALLLGAYGPYPGLSFLVVIGLVPWTVLYTDPRRPAVSLGWYFGSAYLYWLVAYENARTFGLVAWFACALLCTVQGLWVFAPLLRTLFRRFALPRTLLVPMAWVTTEWLRSWMTVSSFDYQALGYALAPFPASIQSADVVGVHGLSFLVAAVSGLIADVGFAWRDRPEGWRASLARPAIAVAVAWAASLAYAAVRLTPNAAAEGPRVAVVQPNVRHTIRNTIGVHLSQMLLTIEEIPARSADLVVWPENAILQDVKRDEVFLEDLGWLASRTGAPILLGASIGTPDNPLRTNNSAILVDGSGSILGRYDKQILFPFSEYVPYAGALGHFPASVRRVYLGAIRGAWGFVPNGVPGDGMRLFRLDWNGTSLPFVTLTCWEAIAPRLASEARRLGARFGVHITSEGEVGGVAHEHALRLCILRAVENRLPFVRAGNSGISCFIDSDGRIRTMLNAAGGPTAAVGTLVDRTSIADPSPTLYARSRGLFEKACAGITLALLALAVVRRRAVGLVAALLLLPGCARTPVALPPEAALQQATRACSAQRLVDAEASLRSACHKESTCRSAIETAGRCLLRDPELAFQFFADVAERQPALAADATGIAAHALRLQNRYADSRAWFERAMRLDPSNRVRAMYGSLLVRGREWDRAIEVLRDASQPESLVLLGQALRSSGRPAEALPVLEEALRRGADAASVWREIGRARTLLGDEDGADDALRRAIEAKPDELLSRFLVAREALRDGRLHEAEGHLLAIQEIESRLGRGPAD
ncbi:MAG TPA: apolipoprotein N-acyltransferase [Candidatus Polarisedimenticolaceae bacterium]